MSFHTTIARLREASFAAPVAGENPNTCRVGRQDLRTALHVIDRLDADLRQAGTLAHGALDPAPRAVNGPVANSIQWPTMPACKGQSPVLFEDGYAEGWAKCMDECRRAVSQASAPVADERAVANAQAAFEAWSEGTNQGYDLTRMNSGKLATYESDLTEHAWRGYCHAALASAPVAPQACPTDVCQAGRQDGVLCANDECDRANGVRPASSPVADEPLPPLRVGNLPTMSQEEYPGLGDWWVQLWAGDEVLARVYGSTPQQAKARATALASAPVAEQAALSAQSATKDDKAALGLPECGKPLCAPGEHHPLCRHGWAEKKAASAPVAGDGKTRVPGDQLGGPAAAWDDGAQSDPNRPESRASIESKGGALAPVAGKAVNLQAAREYLDQWGCLADPNVRALLENAERAAPQASEAVRDDVIEQIAALIGGHTWGDASEEVSRLIARHIRKLKSQGAALSAQPADKPATPRAAPAPMPRQQCVCRLAETGNAHTDGGAVYE